MKQRRRAKLTLKNKPVPVQLQLIRRAVEGVEKHPGMGPSLSGCARARALLDAALAAEAEVQSLRRLAKAKVSERNALMKKLRVASRSLVGGVESRSNGDATEMLRAGVDVVAEKSPKGLMPKPTRARATPGELEGTVIFRWKSLHTRYSYIVQMTTDPSGNTGWRQLTLVSRAKYVVKGLKPGAQYWFRVAAVNAYGTGPWSDAVAARAA
ncbi:MAG TPA: fibronectin type III domain-containing protein [Verrucomicrobiae bacterium]|jgi:hypothetical protein